MSVLIVDIDNTIADDSHRRPLFEQQKFEDYHALCIKDKPIQPVIDTVQQMVTTFGLELYIVTGRPNTIKQQTIDWLNANTPFTDYHLITRIDEHSRDDVAGWKATIVDRMLANGFDIVTVIDDHQETVARIRELGVSCLIP